MISVHNLVFVFFSSSHKSRNKLKTLFRLNSVIVKIGGALFVFVLFCYWILFVVLESEELKWLPPNGIRAFACMQKLQTKDIR